MKIKKFKFDEQIKEAKMLLKSLQENDSDDVAKKEIVNKILCTLEDMSVLLKGIAETVSEIEEELNSLDDFEDDDFDYEETYELEFEDGSGFTTNSKDLFNSVMIEYDDDCLPEDCETCEIKDMCPENELNKKAFDASFLMIGILNGKFGVFCKNKNTVEALRILIKVADADIYSHINDTTNNISNEEIKAHPVFCCIDNILYLDTIENTIKNGLDIMQPRGSFDADEIINGYYNS